MTKEGKCAPFWEGLKVLVAGGGGFIGSHLVERLVASGAVVRVPVRHRAQAVINLQKCIAKIQLFEGDLLKMDDCRRATRGMDVIFNLAAKVGGIGYQVAHHGTAFTTNALLNLTLLEAARLEDVRSYQCTSSTCIYSRERSLNAQEDEGFLGDPEPTVYGYGWAKRLAEIQAELYAKEHGMKVSIVRPTNVYGPRDDFSEETAHVIPSLIRRTFESDDKLTVWGNGNQTRTFLYVEDAVRGMTDAMERHAVADPINLGSDEEIAIRDLANLIVRLSGKELRVEFDAAMPEGQARKRADSSKARRTINWTPMFTLEEGLKRTICWYRQSREHFH